MRLLPCAPRLNYVSFELWCVASCCPQVLRRAEIFPSSSLLFPPVPDAPDAPDAQAPGWPQPHPGAHRLHQHQVLLHPIQ